MGMKILIIEDNPQMRQMIRALVSDLAEDVTEWADGSEAVATYAAQQFNADDRVLMDLKMPGIGGLVATRRVRAAFPTRRSSSSRNTTIRTGARQQRKREPLATCSKKT